MAPRRPFRIVYDPEVSLHLATVDRRWHPAIRRAVEEQLTHEPGTRTRNRKPLDEPSAPGWDWELRCGPGNRVRVFYWIDAARREVQVLAVGVKLGSRLFVGGEEFPI